MTCVTVSHLLRRWGGFSLISVLALGLATSLNSYILTVSRERLAGSLRLVHLDVLHCLTESPLFSPPRFFSGSFFSFWPCIFWEWEKKYSSYFSCSFFFLDLSSLELVHHMVVILMVT